MQIIIPSENFKTRFDISDKFKWIFKRLKFWPLELEKSFDLGIL